MIDKNAKNHEAVRKMADGIRIAFFLSLITNVYEIYHFVSVGGESRQGISIAVGTLGTILILLASKELRAEKKQALYFWLALLLIGSFRWVFVDAAFDLNIITFTLLLFVILLTLRMVMWTRDGILA